MYSIAFGHLCVEQPLLVSSISLNSLDLLHPTYLTTNWSSWITEKINVQFSDIFSFLFSIWSQHLFCVCVYLAGCAVKRIEWVFSSTGNGTEMQTETIYNSKLSRKKQISNLITICNEVVVADANCAGSLAVKCCPVHLYRQDVPIDAVSSCCLRLEVLSKSAVS